MAEYCCKICTAPCKALAYCCSACDKCCSAACTRLCCCCSCCPEDRPSPLFLVYSLLFNVPIVAAGLAIAFSNIADWDECDSYIHSLVWLFVQAALALFFIAFSVRLYYLFSRPYKGGYQADQNQSRRDDDSFSGRCWNFVCRDVFVFLYFFAAPAAFVWSCIGFGVAADIDSSGSDGCSDSVEGATVALSAVMLAYLAGAALVGGLSCCLEGNRASGSRLRYSDTHTAPAHAAMQHLFEPTFVGAGDGKPMQHATAPPAAYHAPEPQYMGHAAAPIPSNHAVMQHYYNASQPVHQHDLPKPPPAV